MASDADGGVLTSGVVMAGVIVGVMLLCCASAYLLSKWMHASGGSTGRGSTANSLPSFARTSMFGRGSTLTKLLRLAAGEKAPRRALLLQPRELSFDNLWFEAAQAF